MTSRMVFLRIRALVATLTLSACHSAMPPTAADAMLVGVTTSPPAGSVGAVRWTGVNHGATGTVRFTVQDGIGRLDFSSDFSVTNVPGPFVYVNTTNNANTGRPLRISALKSLSGSQSYAFQIPAGVTFAWVLIWCDPFNVPVAEAPIPATP